MTREQIGKAIKKHREANKISKYSVVQATGLSFGQLTAIEAGNKNYTVDSLAEYLKAINLKMELKAGL